MVKYTYDSWGKIISVKNASGQEITDQNNIAHINPYKYRGYRYDKETGLYYLQSRYYNPEWGRFVNADTVINSYGTLENSNMYSYCNNNPVNMCDSEGDFAWLPILGVVAAILTSIPDIINTAQEPTLGNAVLLATNFIPGGKAVNVGAKAVKTAAKSAAKNVAKKTPNQLGKEGEEAVSKLIKLPKNTTKISVNNRDRIPDFLSDERKYMAEVKNTATLSFTKQLRDYQKYAIENNYEFVLFVRERAYLSKQLRNSGITIEYIPVQKRIGR